MEYYTVFEGSFRIKKPLNPAQVAYIQVFNEIRHIARNEELISSLPDPIRLDVGIEEVGEEGEYYTGNTNKAIVFSENTPPLNQHGLWCHWTVTDDGTELAWDEGENFYNYVFWLQYLIDHFLIRFGSELSGEVAWAGDEPDDTGIIMVVNNKIFVHHNWNRSVEYHSF